MQNQSDSSANDPLGLDAVDQQIRIEKLRQQIDEVAGGPVVHGKLAEDDPNLEESFLENVLALEEHGYVRPFDTLVADGLILPPPEEMDDAALTAKLWEVIRALAEKRLFLYCTNHLSDREFYDWLWRDSLRQEMMGFGLPFGNCHLDVLGGCSDDDITLHMRYYADDKYRAQWLDDFPDFVMPPKEVPPFDRDQHLPKPAYPY